MPRGPAPGWRRRKEPITDSYIMASINGAGGLGKHDAEGHYARLVIKGLTTKEEAAEWKRSLYRCALYMTRAGIASVSIGQADITRDGKSYKLTFRATDKIHARKYHLATRGSDRRSWPYDPRRGANPKPDPKPDTRPGWPPQGRVPLDVLRQIKGK